MPIEINEIRAVGDVGLIADLKGYSLPAAALTAVRNIRMRDAHAVAFNGHELGYQCDGANNIWAMHAFPGAAGGVQWLFAGTAIADGAGKLCAYDGVAPTDVTPTGGMTINQADRWTGGVFGGIWVMCNGFSHFPHYWAGASQARALPLQWDADSTWQQANVKAAGIRPFKNFLLAWDLQESGTRYPYTVRWSTAADPGAVPATWVPGPTNLAGRQTFPDTGGIIQDVVPLRNYAMVYKQDAVRRLELVPDSAVVFAERRGFDQLGTLNANCVVAWRDRHIVLDADDVVIHNGQSIQSIADRKVQKFLLANVTAEASRNAFVALNELAREVWIALPTQGATYPNFALIFDLVHGTWTMRDLPTDTTWLFTGYELREPTGFVDDWDTGSDADWDTGPDIDWGTVTTNSSRREFVGASAGKTQIFDIESVLHNGAAVECSLERNQIPITKAKDYVTLNGAWPIMTSTGPVQITFYTQDYPTGPRTVHGPYTFDPDTQAYVDSIMTGRYLGYRVQTINGTDFEFYGMELDVQRAGEQ